MSRKFLIAAALLASLTCSRVGAQGVIDPIEQKVDSLLSLMTLEEKVAQMRHIHFAHYNHDGVVDTEKLLRTTGGLSRGCMEAFPYTLEQYRAAVIDIQNCMLRNTRLAIPVIPVLEGLHGVVQNGCTVYPQSIAQAATFNPALVRQMATQIGAEARAIGARQVLAPDLDIARELRWGRVEETYGEDPFLIETMGCAYVEGMNTQGVITTLKHFVAHGTPQSGLNLASVHGGLRDLQDVYLPPFAGVIAKQAPMSVMNAYSVYDGDPLSASSYFLTDILRGQLGFKGYVYSDWGSISMLHNFHKVAPSPSDAARQAISAGLDLEAASNFYAEAVQMVQDGRLTLADVDAAAKHVLYAKFACGLFDDPFPASGDWKAAIHSNESVQTAYQMALESAVLLENDGILPLAGKVKSVAVIGPNAATVQYGDYSWTQDPASGITPLQGISALGYKVNYAQGCDLYSQDRSGFKEAVRAARKSDVSIIFVGSQSAVLARDSKISTTGEGYDLTSLVLPGVQEELINAVAQEGKPLIVVLVAGKPFELERIAQKCNALIVQWYGGEMQGKAIAQLLEGKENFSGRLPVSFPRKTGQLPVYYNYLPSDKGYYHVNGSMDKPGRDYVFDSPYALYTFGYGKSYSSFDYSGCSATLAEDGSLTFKLSITNSSAVDGSEVVQVYMNDVYSSIETPVKSLVAFEKVCVPAGKTADVTLQAHISQMAFTGKDGVRAVEPGDFEVMIARSADQTIWKTIVTVDGSSSMVVPGAASAAAPGTVNGAALSDDDDAMKMIGQTAK